MAEAVAPRGHQGRAPALPIQTLQTLAGVVAPIMFWSLFILAGLLRRGYYPVKQYGSELGVGPHAWLQDTNFIVFGVLEIAFAFALQRGVAKGGGSWLGPALIGLAGVSIVIEGFCEALFGAGTPGRHTLPGTTHVRSAQLLSLSLIAAFVIIAPRLRRDRRWHGFAPYSILAAILGLVTLAALQWSYLAALLAPWIGLVQRAHYAVLFGWLEVLALRLLILAFRTHAGGVAQPGQLRRYRHRALYSDDG